ncbi:MAG: PilZ domain-containing protein [Anderseniella sp.]
MNFPVPQETSDDEVKIDNYILDYYGEDAAFEFTERQPETAQRKLMSCEILDCFSTLMGNAYTATVGSSVANAQSSGDGKLSFADPVSCFLPDLPVSLKSLPSHLASVSKDKELSLKLLSLEAKFNFAIQLTQKSTSANSQESREFLADRWKEVCDGFLGALETTSAISTDLGIVLPDTITLLDLLKACANGEWPCLDDQMAVSIPGWAERRRDDRITCAIAIQIEVEGKAVEATITDISQFGLGLEGCPDLDTGDSVVIATSSDHSLTGHVAWSVGESAGVHIAAGIASGCKLSDYLLTQDGEQPTP